MCNRQRWPSRLRILLLLAMVASLPSSALTQETAESEKRPDVVASGFLGDLSDLKPYDKKPKQILVWRERPGILAEYQSFLVERPLIYFLPDAKAVTKGIDPAEMQQLADSLHDEVSSQLEKADFELVSEVGDKTLIVRSAITDVDPVNPSSNVATKAAGIALGVGLLAPRADLGSASIEVEFLDGETGRRVAAVAAAKEARRFGGTIKGSKRWGDVRAAFEKWAQLFRKQLEAVREER